MTEDAGGRMHENEQDGPTTGRAKAGSRSEAGSPGAGRSEAGSPAAGRLTEGSPAPRVLLAAPSSGSGKTLITCALLQALKNRGLRVSSAKCGPDYIDPMFHRTVIGARSCNLDSFFTDPGATEQILAQTAAGTDITVIEGVMGYYDGLGGISAAASSADIARITKTPVILIVNARGASLSLAALIRGFLDFHPGSSAAAGKGSMAGREEDRGGCRTEDQKDGGLRASGETRIRGVILNHVGGPMTSRLKVLIEDQVPEVKVLGYVPDIPDLSLKSRHLGLVMPDEVPDLQDSLNRLAGVLEETLDLDGILRLAGSAPPLGVPAAACPETGTAGESPEAGVPAAACPETGTAGESPEAGVPAAAFLQTAPAAGQVRIALAKDEAFCFIYEENLALLRRLGARIIPFSPCHDSHLPENVNGLLLYGGYPELYAQTLSENRSMLAEIHDTICGGLPTMAECGGFMYLLESMEDSEGRTWPMAGVLQGRSFRTDHLTRFGYIELTHRIPDSAAGSAQGAGDVRRGPDLSRQGGQYEAEEGRWFLEAGPVRAHEFHYYDSTDNGDACLAQKPLSSRFWQCMHVTDRMAAGFPHLYYYSNPLLAENFVKLCREAGRP